MHRSYGLFKISNACIHPYNSLPLKEIKELIIIFINLKSAVFITEVQMVDLVRKQFTPLPSKWHACFIHCIWSWCIALLHGL